MSRRPTPIHPLPEAVRSERYDVKSGRGSADNTNHVLHVPLDDSPKSLRIRAHEIAHALLSPERPDAPEGIDMRAIQRAEDLRMNVHTDKTAARKVLAAPLIDGSVDLNRFVGNRLEAFTSVLSLVHTGDEAKFLEALYRVDPDLSEEVAEFGERAWDAMYAKDETTWEDALRLALAAMEAADLPPEPEQEQEGEAGEAGEAGEVGEASSGESASGDEQESGEQESGESKGDEDPASSGASAPADDGAEREPGSWGGDEGADEDEADGGESGAGGDESEGDEHGEGEDGGDGEDGDDGEDSEPDDLLDREVPTGRRRRVQLAPSGEQPLPKAPPPPAADPDVESAVRDMLRFPMQKGGGWRGSHSNWGTLRIEKPPRPLRLPKGIHGRTRRADITGAGLRHPNRWATDKALFESRGKRIGGATILIDTSGSMSLSEADVEKMVTLAPAATIAVYAGEGRSGVLRIVAKDGRRVREGSLHPQQGGNIVDGPALRWLAKQGKPRLWVSDGIVSGVHEAHYVRNLYEDAAEISREHSILRVPNVAALERWLKDTNKGRRKVKMNREGVYK